ncbi:MAG: Lipoprotein-releasing system transmembrane protein LolE [Alphaproteobacteria bacterium MarineAlpha5_Bin9]|nr:MAG: Lipoprotein-releasing system transmembrane protein LolE [Alphaproteobacteria bacterium MarineAlpha5_Bin9]
MFKNYEYLILKRFLFSKKSDGYISIFSWFSIIGITLGVSVIIIVMSVMNGFREELTNRLLGINGHINILSTSNEITESDKNIIINIKDDSLSFFPIIETQALIIGEDLSKGIFIRSYEVEDIKNKKIINKSLIKGRIYKTNSNEVIIGNYIASKLNLDIGSKFKIAIPKSDNTIFGGIPRFKTLQVSGIFNLGMYEYDSNFIFTDSSILRKLLLIKENNFSSIEVISSDPSKIENFQSLINNQLSQLNIELFSISWKENNFALLNALKVEKNVMFLILILIILVASMNIISGLIIFVKEKNKDIGILKTIGMNNFSLIKIFASIGLFISLIGTIFGVIFGLIFLFNIKNIQNFLEFLFNQNLFSPEIYYLSSLPARLNLNEVFIVVLVSIFISFFSIIFPAYRAAKIDPIKTIKNE